MKSFVYCPFCATPLQTRQAFGRERPACPACGFIQFHDPKVAASMLITEQRQVLLICRGVPPREGFWALPAGFVEADETPEEAAVREAAEETGLHVQSDGLLALRRIANPERAGVLICYRGRVLGGKLQAADDVSDARWFAVEDIPWNDLAFETTHEMLHLWSESLAAL